LDSENSPVAKINMEQAELTGDEEMEFRQAVLFIKHVSLRTPPQNWNPTTEEKRALIRRVKQPQFIAFFNRFKQPGYNPAYSV
tara:strand:- start:75 stop:323 length:249 start_codon:yes stop_codon:yes gene_type:complete